MNRLRKLTALLLAALLLTIALPGFAQAASSETVATAKHTAVRKVGVSFTTMKSGGPTRSTAQASLSAPTTR